MKDHSKPNLPYQRIMLKLSGESLMGSQHFGIDADMLHAYANRIKEVVDLGIEVAVVIGGGNIYRGLSAAATGIERVQGDHMGMLATIINGMALQSALEGIGVYTRLMTAIEMKQIAEPFIRRRAIRHLEKGRVIILSGGTGHPYFTTDSAAALRAIEIYADVFLKGTRVDGIYSDDPEKNPNALRFDNLSFTDAIKLNLNIMDATAFTMCRENNLPIVVFDITQPDNLLRLVQGERIGTFVENTSHSS